MLGSRVKFQTSHVSLDICSMTAESVMVTVVMATVMLVTCTTMLAFSVSVQVRVPAPEISLARVTWEVASG